MNDIEHKAHVVPADVDPPVPILFWDPLEISVALAAIGFGFVLRLAWLGVVIAFAVLIGARRLKRGAKRGAAQHWMWRIGLQADTPLKQNFPPAWELEFVE